jgi:hypothetical protein
MKLSQHCCKEAEIGSRQSEGLREHLATVKRARKMRDVRRDELMPLSSAQSSWSASTWANPSAIVGASSSAVISKAPGRR